jgi:hypothetical protein
MDAKKLFAGMSDQILQETVLSGLEVASERNLQVDELAGSVALSETVDPVTFTPENARITAEYLFDTFDNAYQGYSFLVESSNTQRATVMGRDEPELLKVVDRVTILKEVESILATPRLLEELQADADYFTRYPQLSILVAGFDLLIVPEGLTPADEQASAKALQTKITPDYTPYIRSEVYNDVRSPTVTGKGFRVVFAPRHYNVPTGTASNQTEWMKQSNHQTTATELQTVTDTEALAQINNLQQAGELNDRGRRFSKTYFRRFDQTPFGGRVSDVRVSDDGRLRLDRSGIRYGNSTRALVVPKA